VWGVESRGRCRCGERTRGSGNQPENKRAAQTQLCYATKNLLREERRIPKSKEPGKEAGQTQASISLSTTSLEKENNRSKRGGQERRKRLGANRASLTARLGWELPLQKSPRANHAMGEGPVFRKGILRARNRFRS